ncbi:vacuolar protein sorting-associated protein 26B-like [Sinocyclocheilus grahami]|uniref:vacuolar protein sorting-associated protein 26B-like n=1 Tax=Sinocyclocheilus grahami TaxID=75366 RepID=UPI0007AC656C|nr:PREDICTED: vacuolar protein sorting-associated protein 26B-like [Sinocyclocheilus grahami]
MSFFSFGQTAEIDIVLNDAETRKKVEHKTEDGKKDKYFLFYDGETVSGKVNVTLKNPGKRLEHQGIKIEFIGQIGKYVSISAQNYVNISAWIQLTNQIHFYTGESIPIRLFLAGYEMTPTMRDINKKFSVRYYLNLVLIDEEERRYFKQQEITLWRKGDVVRKSMSHQAAIASQRFEGSASSEKALSQAKEEDD